MPSIQSKVIEFWIRRLNLFSSHKIDEIELRKRIEWTATRMKPACRVEREEVDAGGVQAEWLIPPDAPEDRVLLYIHGGAWFMGSINTHRPYIAKLVCASGIRALAINYRLAPEHPFPAGLEDCIAAYEWLLMSGFAAQNMIVAGDSAGGNLTLSLLVALRDSGRPLPAAAVGISPATDLSRAGIPEETQIRRDPFFAHMEDASFLDDYIGDHNPKEPMISPVYADLRGLPPLLIHVGEHELLLNEVVRFGERAAAAGVDARTVVWPGMFHVFHMFERFVPEARSANEDIAAFIKCKLE